MTRRFAVAGVQMYLSAVHSNLEALRSRLDVLQSTFPWVEMVMFSELAVHGFFLSKAEPMPGPTENAFCDMARKHKIWLIPGSMYEKKDGKIYNTIPVINPDGDVVGRYRKMFPFRPYEEHVASGDDFLVFDVPGIGRFGVSICYDIWFPETTRTLAAMGAQVLLHPTMTNTIDRNVELAIVRAAAAQNQMYILDINGLGDCGNGQSLIVGPEGYVIHQAGSGSELMPVEINLDRVDHTRREGIQGLGQPLKSFRDRKVVFDVYRPEVDFGYLAKLGPLEKKTRRSLARGDESCFEGQVPTTTDDQTES